MKEIVNRCKWIKQFMNTFTHWISSRLLCKGETNTGGSGILAEDVGYLLPVPHMTTIIIVPVLPMSTRFIIHSLTQ